MRVRATAGFTLIELLVVISIIGLLAAVLLPIIPTMRIAAAIQADAMQLRTHAQWLEVFQQKHGESLPREGGHRFVLATWTSGVVDHTEENLDRYFTPGARDNDPDFRAARDQVEVGQDPWADPRALDSLQTHYAGRAREHLLTAARPGEAWMATDNEGRWLFWDGTVNVLFSNAVVRTYSYQDLQKRFGLPALDRDDPLVTVGAESPIPECRRLAW